MFEKQQMMVRYDLWCDKCRHKGIEENDEPCENCLEHPVRDNSERPINFEE